MVQPTSVMKPSQYRDAFARPEQLARLAWQSLVAEAELTPKPGLVDRRSSGSHSDLSLELMRKSADAIAPYFTEMALASAGVPADAGLRVRLAHLGRQAESAMFHATTGSNAHKGAIWILGLLVCAASQSIDCRPEHIARNGGLLARLPDQPRPQGVTHGDLARERYGVTGARGEAHANFPHVVNIGLPRLREARTSGRTERDSRLTALLAIMSRLEDTCVLYRGGRGAQRFVHAGAALVLQAGGPGRPKGEPALIRLGHEFVSRRISPGGSADLLAATLFLDALERGLDEVEKDDSVVEENDGAY